MRLDVTPAMRQLMEDAGCSDLDGSTISWSDLKAIYARSDYATRNISLRSVCKGSSIVVSKSDNKCTAMTMSAARRALKPTESTIESRTESSKPPKLISHLQDLQNRLDQKEYDRMIRDVTVRERRAEAEKDTSLSTYKEQMRFGAHVIAMMAVFFLVGYFASFRVVTSEALRVLCGIFGMFTAMVVETTLFIFKDTRDVQRVKETQGENISPSSKVKIT
jgi:hypothetical protein